MRVKFILIDSFDLCTQVNVGETFRRVQTIEMHDGTIQKDSRDGGQSFDSHCGTAPTIRLDENDADNDHGPDGGCGKNCMKQFLVHSDILIPFIKGRALFEKIARCAWGLGWL